MESTANLHAVAALVAGLAALALGHAVLVDLTIHDISRISAAVGAFWIGLLLDHEFATVPAGLGRRLAHGAVLLHEADLSLALVVERVGRPQVLLAGRRGEPGPRAPVSFEEAELLLLLGVGRNDHRLGRILLLLCRLPGGIVLIGAWPLAAILVGILLARRIAEAIVRALVVGLAGDVGAGRIGVGRRTALDRLA